MKSFGLALAYSSKLLEHVAYLFRVTPRSRQHFRVSGKLGST